MTKEQKRNIIMSALLRGVEIESKKNGMIDQSDPKLAKKLRKKNMTKKEVLQKTALSPELLTRAVKGSMKKSLEHLNNSHKNMGSLKGIVEHLNSVRKLQQSNIFFDALKKMKKND
jgi:hypothetical protein